jgi:hypothetical protein
MKLRSVFFCMLGLLLVSCGNQAADNLPFTPTPTHLELIDGEFDACLLLTPEEVEKISQIKVTSEIFPISGTNTCRYISEDGAVVLLTSITTDTTLKKANKTYSAADWYEMEKAVALDMNEIFHIQDLDNLGDKAYSKEGSFLDFVVLKNNIYYFFSTRTDDTGGIGNDALMDLAKLAISRAP